MLPMMVSLMVAVQTTTMMAPFGDPMWLSQPHGTEDAALAMGTAEAVMGGSSGDFSTDPHRPDHPDLRLLRTIVRNGDDRVLDTSQRPLELRLST
jgi:hypothetical protein